MASLERNFCDVPVSVRMEKDIGCLSPGIQYHKSHVVTGLGVFRPDVSQTDNQVVHAALLGILCSLSSSLLHGTGGLDRADDGVLVSENLEAFDLHITGNHTLVKLQRSDIKFQLIGEVLHEAADLEAAGALGELTTCLDTLGVTGELKGNIDGDGLLLINGEEVNVEAVVLYRVPLVFVCNSHVGFATELKVNDVSCRSMGDTLKFLFVNGEENVFHSKAIEVARNQALTAESLDDGFVAFLADFAFKRKMLHCFVC